MALSRRDVIIASIVAFISWGFVTHWIPTLRWIPHAFLAGVTATLLGFFCLILSVSKQPREHQRAGIDRKRNVAFVSPRAWRAETAALKGRLQYTSEQLYPQSPVVSGRFDTLVGLLLRDFVTSWYGAISSRPTFSNEVDRAIRAALVNIRDRVLNLDMIEVGVSRMLPIVTEHMRDFYEAERLVRGRKLSRNVTESEELDLAIAGKYRDGHLHPAASLAYSSTKLAAQQHLRSVVTRVLPKVLPPSMTASPAVTVLIKEIVSCAVLSPVMQILGDPDVWNQLLEAYTVRRLRAALDEHAPPSPKPRKDAALTRLAPNDSERRFEKFIRAIRRCNSLADARRFRSEITSQLSKPGAIGAQDPVYLRRLETGKRILDQRIAQLSAGGTSKPTLSVQTRPESSRSTSRIEAASLRQVLYDSSGLSYFMEYMDRMGLMRLVQFWIVVDGFRNPLEADTDEPEEYLTAAPSWTDSERADLMQINEAYLMKPELKVSDDARRAVKEFLKAGSNASPVQYHAARRAVLHAQSAVYEELTERYFPKFKASDLYHKWLASEQASIAPRSLAVSRDESPSSRRPAASLRPAPLKHATSTGLRTAAPDLRRAVASSSDLRSNTRAADNAAPSRRSMDDSAARKPLFDDDDDDDPLARSTQSLQSVDSEPEQHQVNSDDPRIVDAMQEALNDIMGDDPDKTSLFSDPSVRSPEDDGHARGSLELPRPTSPASEISREKPSIASLGLLGTPNRRSRVFSDDLFGDEEKFLEDEYDTDGDDEDKEDRIHEAAPGDLGLAEAVDALTAEIERLVTQESIVDSLTKKAELTNNSAELRILRKSKASLQREIHRKELQKQQYIIQESDNSLYGRATVSIQSIMVATEDDGREYALYVIEVRRQAGDQMPAAAWVVTRRYSEFHELNKRLRSRYPMIRNLDFPRRQMVLKLQKDFLQKRRVALERYLRELLLVPAVCRSRELRAFLSQQAISSASPSSQTAETRDLVTRIYNSVTDGMEDFLGNLPALDQLSVAGQNLISAATTQLAATNGGIGATIPTAQLSNDPATAAEAEKELRAFESRELEPFVKPICDLFLEIFELNKDSNWLRGRAVVVVLHQLLGGTIERKVRESAKAFMQEENMVKYIDLIKETMWPGGKMKQPGAPRSSAEKDRSRKEAGLLLATLVPELAGSVVGRQNAQAASRRILATVNNERLNTHLAFTLLDEVVKILFEER
ncbi:tRNA (guanine-N(7)-)-methyltransferase (tRNA(m7G46)-methyltransferase) [Coniosporium tulheliwenetii]|uniref:tRNA (Guanine-N(7)-)-methyltransferase (tRNA(m7G46)-methyltransferase) n=1 Tax=Coniosporium tulheliwenetii TaxID=3383036 RepID=A0ACC2ZJV0_9PEZI|nr:tRNA (guanine-N(7)-)-methyltransferase (tRNA(m7G46)-methyltransferase) [Cladosporium sp. JES 115]